MDKIQLNQKSLKKMYYKMLFLRRFEEKAGQMYGLRKIGGFCHLYNGQEAVAIGVVEALDLKKDYVLTAYRDHGHALACGMDPKALMAELYGKVTGCSRGKGGSMHLFDVKNHMYGGNGIVGGQIPVATGVAFAQKYRNENGVTTCFFGDGAIHQGAFHESLNMAKIWNLPILYICENNQFGMGTKWDRVSSVTDFSIMGSAYGIEGYQIDGMDVIAVYNTVKKVADKARKEGVPAFLEIRTYRYKGHSMSDPGTYRTKEELEEYKKQDPLYIFKSVYKDNLNLSDVEEKQYEIEIKKIIDESVEFAENSPQPPLESMYEDIYS